MQVALSLWRAWCRRKWWVNPFPPVSCSRGAGCKEERTPAILVSFPSQLPKVPAAEENWLLLLSFPLQTKLKPFLSYNCSWPCRDRKKVYVGQKRGSKKGKKNKGAKKRNWRQKTRSRDLKYKPEEIKTALVLNPLCQLIASLQPVSKDSGTRLRATSGNKFPLHQGHNCT